MDPFKKELRRSCSYWTCTINIEAICNQTNGYMSAAIIICSKHLCIDCIVCSLNKIWGACDWVWEGNISFLSAVGNTNPVNKTEQILFSKKCQGSDLVPKALSPNPRWPHPDPYRRKFPAFPEPYLSAASLLSGTNLTCASPQLRIPTATRMCLSWMVWLFEVFQQRYFCSDCKWTPPFKQRHSSSMRALVHVNVYSTSEEKTTISFKSIHTAGRRPWVMLLWFSLQWEGFSFRESW